MMIRNLINDRFLAVTSIEMIVLGLFLSSVRDVFSEPNNIRTFLTHAQDPIVFCILISVGTFGIVVCMYDIKTYRAHRWALTLQVAAWSAYLAVFTWHDIRTGNPIGLTSYFILFIIFRVLGELKYGKTT